ncbi:MAG: ATP synthase F0 subunit B [Firmicutes bacterium GWF2_51_9]|nr:F0F1 ATP synthase subunit B [Erysipelotrichaceae bacterium]OGS54662.1 MAG: ATP synthase F0 subunit B [Firmicutes bacterium GWF2_51_9]OGS58669.1 MAG: ATP synthase F0 subunit B [Firmicutes bacterium GWE2_51_13]HAM62562.1 ATP synthase F0 subunit B [Erysipelotrichaceae bacterium]HAO62027.1 ATP synthase F0 subunit B [Erysipelotrichaceae bacterium]
MNLDIAGKLFPDPLTMLVQLTATAFLLYWFKRFLWKPTLSFLEKRAEYAERQLKDADEANLTAKALASEAESKLVAAAHEAMQLVERGKEEGQRVKEKLTADGKREADLKLQAAIREITYQRQQMDDSIQSEIVDVALLAAQKLIEGRVDEDSDRALIEKFMKDVRS